MTALTKCLLTATAKGNTKDWIQFCTGNFDQVAIEAEGWDRPNMASVREAECGFEGFPGRSHAVLVHAWLQALRVQGWGPGVPAWLGSAGETCARQGKNQVGRWDSAHRGPQTPQGGLNAAS